MDEWLFLSFVSCLLYSLRTIFNKLSIRTIDSTTSGVIQLPVRTTVTILAALWRKKPGPSLSPSTIISRIGELSLYGSIYTSISCIFSVLATILMGDAMQVGGNASEVAVITGSYPAAAYVICILFGLEEINTMKLFGVALAIGSCYCFANAH